MFEEDKADSGAELEPVAPIAGRKAETRADLRRAIAAASELHRELEDNEIDKLVDTMRGLDLADLAMMLSARAFLDIPEDSGDPRDLYARAACLVGVISFLMMHARELRAAAGGAAPVSRDYALGAGLMGVVLSVTADGVSTRRSRQS